MMRTVSRDSRSSSGSGRSGSPMKTTSPASAATSVPLPPMARPTSARARAGASLMPSPTMATRAPADGNRRNAGCAWLRGAPPAGVSSFDELRLLLRAAARRGRRDAQLAAPGRGPRAAGRRSAGRCRRCPARAAPPTTPGGLRPHAVAGADGAQDHARRGRPAGPSARPRRAAPAAPTASGRQGDALFFQQPAVPTTSMVEDCPRRRSQACRDAGAGMGLELLDRLRRQTAGGCLAQDEPGQQMLAALLRRGRGAEHARRRTRRRGRRRRPVPAGPRSACRSCRRRRR